MVRFFDGLTAHHERSSRACRGTRALRFGFLAYVASASVAAAQPRVTFNKDIAPIVWTRCATCHRPGEIGPFNLLTYDDVRTRVTQIAAVTARRIMPPWKPEAGKGEFQNERLLLPDELQSIQRWIASGAAEGDAADLPPMPSWNDGWRLGSPDLVVRMPEVYTVPADGTDVFRTFVIPIPVIASAATCARLNSGRATRAWSTTPTSASIARARRGCSTRAIPSPATSAGWCRRRPIPKDSCSGGRPGRRRTPSRPAWRGAWTRAATSSSSCTCSRSGSRSRCRSRSACFSPSRPRRARRSACASAARRSTSRPARRSTSCPTGTSCRWTSRSSPCSRTRTTSPAA